MQYWINTTKTTLLLSLLFFAKFSSGQENSPYTRYALGNVKHIENVANRLMGSVSIADNNSLIVNPTNPATYADLRLTSYNIGFDGSRSNIKSATSSNQVGYATIAYATVGISVNKRIGLSFGLLPQYNSRYNMQRIDTLNGKYEQTSNFYGGGSIQRFYVGAAYKYQDFSIGFNTGYSFGNVVHSSEATFVDSQKILGNHFYGRISVGGIFGQLGALYTKKLKEDYTIKLGASYTLSQQLKANREQYYESYIGDLDDPLYNYKADSIFEEKGKVIIPSIFAVGAQLCDGDYWQLGMDITSSNWSNYRSYDLPDSTGKSWMVKLGGAITPDVNAVNNYWKKVTYRGGVYVGQDIYKFQETAMRRLGVSAGIGLPIKRTNLSIGQLNAGLEVGKRGNTDTGLLQENFTRFLVGITLNDKWFIKRKYD